MFAIVLFLASCAGPGSKVTPLSQQETKPQPIVETQPITITQPAPPVVLETKPLTNSPSTITNPPPTVATQPPPIIAPIPAPQPPPLTGWLSLKEWCAQNNLDAPVVKFSNTETNVLIQSAAGAFIFEPPRRNARWNGSLVGVGFPLQFTNKQPYVHAIDIAKLLRPLLLPDTVGARKTNGILVIDPGHGGPNFGALSFDKKLKEKDLTLDWARRIEKLLEGSAWQVVLTRTNDIDLALTQRVAIAEMKKADLFISLHFNSFRNVGEAGLETYCLTPQGMASHVTRDYPDDLRAAFSNNRFDSENLLLAHDLHKSLLKRTNRKDRGIRRARFMTVLREQNRPAVLLEGGYLSNQDEARLISTPAFRQKLAEAVVEALGVSVPTLTTLRQ